MTTFFSMKGQKSVGALLKSLIPAPATVLSPGGEVLTLAKALEPLNKSLELPISGKTIKEAINTKIAALQAQCTLYQTMQDQVPAPAPAKEGEEVKATADYKWRLDSCQRQIVRLQKIAKYLDDKTKYSLSEYDIESYGL